MIVREEGADERPAALDINRQAFGGGEEASLIEALTYPGGFVSPLEIDDAVTRALAEDLGRAGDVTSIATIPVGTPSKTVLAARKLRALLTGANNEGET